MRAERRRAFGEQNFASGTRVCGKRLFGRQQLLEHRRTEAARLLRRLDHNFLPAIVTLGGCGGEWLVCARGENGHNFAHA